MTCLSSSLLASRKAIEATERRDPSRLTNQPLDVVTENAWIRRTKWARAATLGLHAKVLPVTFKGGLPGRVGAAHQAHVGRRAADTRVVQVRIHIVAFTDTAPVARTCDGAIRLAKASVEIP